MLRLAAFTVLAFALCFSAAQAFRPDPAYYPGVHTGGVSSHKMQRYGQQQSYFPTPRYAQPELQPEQPQGQQVSFSGGGNRAARTALFTIDSQLATEVNNGTVRPSQVLIGRADLNEDGNDEILAYLNAPARCEHDRCDMSVYQLVPGQPLRPLLKDYTTDQTVLISPERTRGWHDLIVYNRRGRQITLAYNGHDYAEQGNHGWGRGRDR